MNESDCQFLQRRRRLARSWNLVGVALLLALAALTATLFYRVPFMANPMYVANRLKTGNLERSTLELMAMLLPVVFLLCVVVTAVVVLFGFAIFSNERRYLAIVDELEHRTTDPQ